MHAAKGDIKCFTLINSYSTVCVFSIVEMGLAPSCDSALQVIAHTHFIDTHANTAMAKRVVPMSLHRYNWNLPTQANSNQPYFACKGLNADCSKLKILAFTPSTEKLLGSSASWHEFAFLLQGLAALATALDRAVAWPSLPCNTTWIARLAPLSLLSSCLHANSMSSAVMGSAVLCLVQFWQQQITSRSFLEIDRTSFGKLSLHFLI